MNYYIALNGQTVGPMTREQVFAYPVNAQTMISKDGGAWLPLMQYPELMQLLSIKQGGNNINPMAEKKTICGIMAILFGTLGIQYFILGKVGGGFLTILLSLVTCGLWGILTFVQGIMMLCMSDDEFVAKYVDNDKTLPLF